MGDISMRRSMPKTVWYLTLEDPAMKTPHVKPVSPTGGMATSFSLVPYVRRFRSISWLAMACRQRDRSFDLEENV